MILLRADLVPGFRHCWTGFPVRRALLQATPDGTMTAVDTTAVTPLTLDVPQADLDDLRDRLLRTRWPDAETVDDTSQGPRLAEVR